MPRRWLSIRDRKENSKPTSEAPNGFDFAFTTKPDSSSSTLNSPDPQRPLTPGADGHRTRQKPDLSLLIERPPTSKGLLRHNAPRSAGLPESPHIGIAFGSPRNPPQNFPALGIDMAPSGNCFVDDSLPSRSPSTTRWRKIGGLFKPRSNSDKGSSLLHTQPFQSETQHLDRPAHRTQWRHPRSPSKAHHAFREHPAFVKIEQTRDRALTLPDFDPTKLDNFFEANTFPSLRVKIPGSPFDRCSVMFKNVALNAQTPSERGPDHIMEGALSDPAPARNGLDLQQSDLMQQVSSPTGSKVMDRPRTASQAIASNRYSLFPVTPTMNRPQSQHRHSTQLQSRPSTAPEPFSPLPEGFPSPPKHPHQDLTSRSPTNNQEPLQKELPHPKPLATVQICDSATHSRDPSTGEIFFDVKSFRDSKGQDLNQYEMTRPPSAELQLVRSKSIARKQLQKRCRDAAQPCLERPAKTTSAEIDETIALVESLTSSFAPRTQSTEEQRMIRPRRVTSETQNPTVPLPADVDTIPSKVSKKTAPRAKTETLSIAVPSPVLESIEEATPKREVHEPAAGTVSRGAGPVKLNHIASRTRTNSDSVSIPRSRSKKDSSSPPPAVPVKDSKFIPLSKYAPKHTTQELVRQTGVRPTRSNTDDNASYNNGSSNFRRQVPLGRSQTMPSLHSPRSAQPNIVPPVHTNPRVSTHGGREMPMIVAYVKPSAEVSVARTVSLSRRPRAKIMVSRQPSKTNPKSGPHSEAVVAEREVTGRTPVLHEVQTKHKPGLSQDGVLEVTDLSLAKASLPKPSISDITKALEGFPTPPTSAT